MRGSETERSRRRLLRTGLLGAGGIGAAWLAACGGGSETKETAKATTAPPAAGGGSAATAVAAATAQPKRGGTFTFHEQAPLASLDPHNNANRAAQTLAAHAYSRLLKFKTGPTPDVYFNLEFVGDLAEKWEIPSDGTQVTVKLRPGMQFHNKPPVNGRVLTSEDVKFTFDRFRSAPSNTSKDIFGTAANPLVTAVETPDPTTVVFKLATPYAPFLSLLSEGQYLWVFPKEADSGFDPKKEQIGTGPFMLDEVQPDSAVTWKRHPNYFLKDLPYVDSIKRTFIPELAQQVAQFQAGRLDYFEANKDSRDDLVKSNPKATVISYLRAGRGWGLSMQLKGNSPFRDVRVRRAVSLALDRDAWAATAYAGDTYSPSNVIPPTFPKFYLNPTKPEAGPGSQFYKFDPKGARELLRAAGAEGVSFRFVYTNNGYGVLHNSSAEAIAAMLKEAGFNPQIVVLDYLREFIEPTRGALFGNYEGMIYYAPAPYAEPHFYLVTHYHSKGPRFLPGVPDPRMDEMVDKQARTLDEKDRIKQIQDFQKYALEQVYYGYTGPGPQYLFLQPWIKNYNYAFGGWGSHIAESAIYSWIDRG